MLLEGIADAAELAALAVAVFHGGIPCIIGADADLAEVDRGIGDEGAEIEGEALADDLSSLDGDGVEGAAFIGVFGDDVPCGRIGSAVVGGEFEDAITVFRREGVEGGFATALVGSVSRDEGEKGNGQERSEEILHGREGIDWRRV